MFINCEQLKIGSIPDVQKRLTAFAFSYMIQVRLAQPATGIAFVTTQSAIALTRLSCVAPRFRDIRYHPL
ncbi:MAG: hypothetical protein V7K43_10185 [Nostoc sp.]